MSNYNTTLQSNNTDLQAILNTINELPEAVEQTTPVISVNTSGLITATAGTKSATHQLAFQPAKTITPTTTNQTAVSSGYYTGGAVTVKGDSNLVAGNIKSGVSIFGVNGTYAGSGGSGDTSMEDGLIAKTLSGDYTNDRVTKIGNYAFYSCGSLTTVNFPMVSYIGSEAFYACHDLKTISFPAATFIDRYAFYCCNSLTIASFPAVTSIGTSAFYDCYNLNTLNFPMAISIPSFMCRSCRNLQTINFPVATSIGSNAFNSCSALSSVSLSNITYLSRQAFGYCSNLISVSLPMVSYIGSEAFYACSKLKTISFPAATGVGSYAFCRCSRLSTIYFAASSVCTLANSNAFSSTSIGTTKGSIFVPASLVSSYKIATNWTYFANRIYSIT